MKFIDQNIKASAIRLMSGILFDSGNKMCDDNDKIRLK